VTEVLALGGLSIASLSAATSAQRSVALTTPGLVAAAASLLAAATFARASRRHPGALHFVLPAATVGAWLATCALAPRPERVWPAGTILAACAGLFAARWLDGAAELRARKVVLRWSVAIGAALVLCALVVDASVAGPNVWTMSALTAAVFGLSAHLAGGWSLRSLHLAAAPSLVLALATYGRSAGWWVDTGSAWVGSLAAAGLAYGAAALPYESVAAKRGTTDRFEVMDDLSRLSLLGAFAWASIDRAPPLWVAAVGAALLARSLRDRSRDVGLAGALALGYAAHLASGAVVVAQRAMVLGALTLVAAVVATALGHIDRTRGVAEGVEARRLFGGMPLPGAATGVVLARDAFADAAVVGYALGAAILALWITRWDAPSRPWALQGGALLVASCVAAFLSPGFVDRRVRGATATLFAAGAAVALTAVANRIGRPLAPQVIGLRLTLIAAAVWGLRQLAERYGPRVAVWLDARAAGTRYKAVFSVGVVALACVMVVDAALVGAPDLDRALLVTPPLLLLGASLALALMARGTRWSGYWFPAAALVVPGAALAAAQRGAIGLALEALTDGTSRWVPSGSAAAAAPGRWRDPVALMVTPEALDGVRARAVTGVALVALLFALTAAFIERSGESAPRRLAPLFGEQSVDHTRGLRGALVLWSALGGAVVLATSWWRGNLPASALVALAGVALVGARSRRAGVAGVVLGAMASVHALALTAPQIPWWAGVAWMALAMAIVHTGPWVARRYELDPEEVYERTHPLALAVGMAALVYALATGGAWTDASAGADVLWCAFTGLGGRWMASPSLPLTLGLAAWCAGAAASQWEAEGEDRAARTTAASAVLLAAVATWTGMIGGYVVTHATVSAGAWTLPFARGWLALRTLGTPLSLASALVAGAAHALGRAPSRGGDRGRTAGARWGRDAMLLAAVGWAAVFAGLASRGGAAVAPSWALEVGIAGFCAGVLVAGHAAWAEGTARHVYFIQTAIVAVYGLVRTELARDLPPEADAVFGLVMGFLLVGVTVQARRGGIPPVAAATRRFAALLPLGVALVLPQEATLSTAMAAAGSAILYGTLGYLERSRLLGSLGAAAGNLALLLFALSRGLQGVEVWLAPAGLFVLAIAQLFAASLAHPSRVTLRVVGSLLLYLPAATQIAFQVGNAREGAYPVVFGLACLVGVAAGMVLHIRAYLALGVTFLVLDVVASLVRAGLRDHRVGFLLLSSAGLAILGGMVFVTLRREAVRGWMARWRARLRAWD
jgi:hypothetical protein